MNIEYSPKIQFPETKIGSPFFWIKDLVADTRQQDGEIKGTAERTKLQKALRVLGLADLTKPFLENRLLESEKRLILENIRKHFRRFEVTDSYIPHNEKDESVKWLADEIELANNVASYYPTKDKFYEEYIYRINHPAETLKKEVDRWFIVESEEPFQWGMPRFPETGSNSIFFAIKDKIMNTAEMDGKIRGAKETAKLAEALNVLELSSLTENFLNNRLLTNDKKQLIIKIKLHLKLGETAAGLVPHAEVNNAVKWLAEEIGLVNLNVYGRFNTMIIDPEYKLDGFIDEEKAKEFAIAYNIKTLETSQDEKLILEAISILEKLGASAESRDALLSFIEKNSDSKNRPVYFPAVKALFKICPHYYFNPAD